jgi:hypothetical protein
MENTNQTRRQAGSQERRKFPVVAKMAARSAAARPDLHRHRLHPESNRASLKG